MKKNKTILIVLLFSMVLSACKTNSNAPTALPGQVDTQVSAILTSMPSSTALVQQSPTNSISPTQTPPQFITATSVTATPTIETAATMIPSPTLTQVATANLVSPTNSIITSTLSFTPTPMITATFPAGDPRVKLGNPFWQDSFKNDLNWPTGSDPLTSIEIQNNTLTLTALTQLDGWRLSYPNLQNFYLEAAMQSSNCVSSDHFGLIIRVPDKKTANQGYLFGISCDGQYSLRKWDGKKMLSLVNWTANPGIVVGPNSSNRLGFMANGNHLGIYANGVLLAESTDTTLTGGAFGIFVGGKTSNVSVTVTSVAYWVIQ